jgi:hypothetical protein
VTPAPFESLETVAVSENVPFVTIVGEPPPIVTEIGLFGKLLTLPPPHPPATNANGSATYIMKFNVRNLMGLSGDA